jgi:hypothetical protein
MTMEQDGIIALQALTLDGIEELRIATENRVRALTRDEEDADGEIRGLGLNALDPRVQRAMGMLESLKGLEHDTTLELQRSVRAHPLGDWVKRSKGVGEKQAARLLASIGDPYWHTAENRPRTLAELWAYCGYGVQDGMAPKRKKGQPANWSNTAKMRVFLVAESCMKTKGDYRKIYDEGRERYKDAVHTRECVRCGPAGKPALPGSPLSAGHQHARALRLVSKAVLKDMWLEARAIHTKESAA